MSSSIINKYSVVNAAGFRLRFRRLILPAVLVVLMLNPATRQLILSVLSDAFWQVSVFVAFTLVLYHFIGAFLSRHWDHSYIWQNPVAQVGFASVMGVLPGCGGAIIVITQFVAGRISFGAVVAVLTATMGDAAFLLLAAQPSTGAGIMCLGVVVATVVGLIVHCVHGEHFLRLKTVSVASRKKGCALDLSERQLGVLSANRLQGLLWQFFLLPGIIVAVLLALQLDVATQLRLSDDIIAGIGASMALLLIILWSLSAEVSDFRTLVAEDDKWQHQSIFQKVALDTNFITSWVIIAFVVFELLNFYGYFNLSSLFTATSYWLPMLAVLVGIIPGCGPQIITTTLYLNGHIPLSAQLGNAISNDGDALFPALAFSPKVALVATVYTSIPALVIAYGYFWLFEA